MKHARFVRVTVRLHRQLRATLPGMAAAVALLVTATASAGKPPTHVENRVLVKFKSGVRANSAEERAALQATRTSVIKRVPRIGLTVVRVPLGAREADHMMRLRNRPEVEFAELDLILPPDELNPNDPMFVTSQWGLQQIECPAAWSITTGSADVIIAILDTGVNASHPDLAPQLVSGWNVYDDNSSTEDVTGHGTAVAGVAGAATDNAAGVAGGAWDCRIMPIRISDDSGYASSMRAANGLLWAADHGARVANISYAFSGTLAVQLAAQTFQEAGGVVTISAGNQGAVISAPDNPYVLTVSATDPNDEVPGWSNVGSNIDLAAPGVNMSTTAVGGLYGSGSGTSFSAPTVAAVAGLVISANPALSGQQVQEILKQSANDLGPTGWDSEYGWGRVNAGQAVTIAQGIAPGDPVVPTSDPPTDPPPAGDTQPPTISISSPADGANVHGQVRVRVTYADNVDVVKVELYVDGAFRQAKTDAPFTTRWHSRSASAGAHTIQVKAIDAAGNAGLSQSITVYR